jgi:hypothetical protein
MAYPLLAGHEREWKVVEYPTGRQQREFNRLQLRSVVATIEQKAQIAQMYGWADEYKVETDEGEEWDFPDEVDLEEFRVKAAQIVFEGFDAELSQATKDNLRGGLVMEGIQDFLSGCGGRKSGPQESSASLTEFLRALTETNTQTQDPATTAGR